MTVGTEHSRESGLVLHGSLIRSQRNQEEFDLVQLRMPQSVRALGERLLEVSPEDQRELLTGLPVGTCSPQLLALGRLDELQREGAFADRHLEGLPHQGSEGVAREPRKVSHQVMVPAPQHTPRTCT